MDTYKIIAINNGTVDVTFSCDNKKQNISGLSVNDPGALDRELIQYGIAYKAGLEVQVAPVDSEVTKMVGKVRNVDAQKLEPAEAEVIAEEVK